MQDQTVHRMHGHRKLIALPFHSVTVHLEAGPLGLSLLPAIRDGSWSVEWRHPDPDNGKGLEPHWAITPVDPPVFSRDSPGPRSRRRTRCLYPKIALLGLRPYPLLPRFLPALLDPMNRTCSLVVVGLAEYGNRLLDFSCRKRLEGIRQSISPVLMSGRRVVAPLI
jgi:hypothetical protein